MKKDYVASLGLPKGFPVNQYENLAEIKAAVGGDETRVTSLVNLYLRQKGPLVEGRDLLSEHVDKNLKFPMKTEKVKKTIDGKETEVTVPSETEGKHLDRFVSSVLAGTTTVAGLTLTGNDEQKEAAVWDFLQKIADKFDLSVDASKPERTSRPKKYENLPKYARDGAEKIIANGKQAQWAKTFATEGVPFEAFDVKDDAEGNKLRLATAIVERESRAPKPQYA